MQKDKKKLKAPLSLLIASNRQGLSSGMACNILTGVISSIYCKLQEKLSHKIVTGLKLSLGCYTLCTRRNVRGLTFI